MKSIVIMIVSVFFFVAPYSYAKKGEGPCKKERMELCSSCEKGDRACFKECMKSNKDKLSDACKDHRKARKMKRKMNKKMKKMEKMEEASGE